MVSATVRVLVKSSILVGALALFLAFVAGCQPSRTAAISQDKTIAGMAELDTLVAKMQVHHRRPFRKPYRDEHARTMRAVAEQAEIVLAAVDSPAGVSALTGTATERPPAVADLRTSLGDLREAALRGHARSVADTYARVKSDYRRAELTGDALR